jgi:opacity protein-like surface antigen
MYQTSYFEDADSIATGILSYHDQGLFAAEGKHAGAIGSLSLGFQTNFEEFLIVGIQADGGLAQVQAEFSGPRNTNYSSSLITTNTYKTCSPPNSDSYSQSYSYLGTENISDSIASRWFISVLGKAGYLINTSILTYALGGWTYANFETSQSNKSPRVRRRNISTHLI